MDSGVYLEGKFYCTDDPENPWEIEHVTEWALESDRDTLNHSDLIEGHL